MLGSNLMLIHIVKAAPGIVYARDDGSYKVNQTEQNLIFKPHSFHMPFVIFPSYFLQTHN